jgi:5'-nucleotidase/UDP-sugar diphosphatase
MASWASLIDETKRMRPVLLLDTGDFTRSIRTPETDLMNTYFFRGLKMMKYDALNIGPNEILFGRDNLLKTADHYDLPILSTNIFDKRGDGYLGPRWITKEVGGRKTLFGRKGSVKVGIFGVALPGFIYSIDEAVPKYYTVEDPRLAALEAVTALRAEGCDLIVALAYMGWDKSLDLAKDVHGIDIVINGRRSHLATQSQMVDSTLVVDTGEKRTTFTEIVVKYAEGKHSATALNRGKAVLQQKKRPDLMKLEKEYDSKKKKIPGIK